jgi:ubiquinone/menaquinone biosynthesis C-methylase UbiE
MSGERDRLRDGYDRIAARYAEHFADELEHKPLDRALLRALAEMTIGRGTLLEIGCGPGQIARFLRDAGAMVEGVDLSPEMIAQARRLHPDIEFAVGDMFGLFAPDESYAGIAAIFAIVNTPPGDLPRALRELHRVLAPGGLLLVSFHIGAQEIHVDQLLGVETSLDFWFFETADVVALLTAAGFTVDARIEREPYPDVEYPSRRAYLLARRPDR